MFDLVLTLSPDSNHAGSAFDPDVNARAHEWSPHIWSQKLGQKPILYLPPLLSTLPVPYQNRTKIVSSDLTEYSLKTSSYLPEIDAISLSLHKALHYIRPQNEFYASTPYADAFNWDELELPEEDEREWYAVAFRSRRRVGSDGTRESTSALVPNHLDQC